MECVDLLMKEHRLIERMLRVMEREIERIHRYERANVGVLERIIDFLREYADRCHHGKEENILFSLLSMKSLSEEHERLRRALTREHEFARKATDRLARAKADYERGDPAGLKNIVQNIEVLARFYPDHIRREDDEFFLPLLDYLSPGEREDLLKEFRSFDENRIHQRYEKTLEELEAL